MIPADETFLDAYLDGELDPAQRLAVEDALLADPRLAQRLQERAQVRQWVGDLPRPTAPRDLSGPILGRVAANPPAWFRRIGRPRTFEARALKLGAGLAAAAGVLIAVGLTWRREEAAHPPILLPAAPPPLVASAPPRPEPTAEPSQPIPTVPTDLEERPADPELPPPVEHVSPVSPAIAAVDEEAERLRVAEQERLEGLLNRADVRRVFVLVDQFDEPTADRLEEAIRKTPRRDSECGRVQVAEGIALDPDHPGRAVVYALALDATEWRRLKSNLGRAFPGHTQAEDRPPASVACQLAQVGDVAFFDAQEPAGEVRPFDEGPVLALRKEGAEPAGPGSSVSPRRAHSPRPAPAAPKRPRRPLTGLVWVTLPSGPRP